MTWELPWARTPHSEVRAIKLRGGHLDLPSSSASLAALPGTGQDRAAFQRVAVRYIKLIKQVRESLCVARQVLQGLCLGP